VQLPTLGATDMEPSARSITPSSTCTAVRVETARATTASFSASSSLEQVSFIPDPTAMSVSIISL
jgi:hypothetical protein